MEWLSNPDLIHSVRDATAGVVDAVLKNNGDTSGKFNYDISVMTVINENVQQERHHFQEVRCFSLNTLGIIRNRYPKIRTCGYGFT